MYYLLKSTVKNYNTIVNRKKPYDHHIDFDVKRYEEIANLTTSQGEDYTTRCLLDCEYIKNHCRLIAVDFGRQNKLDAHLKATQQI